MSSDGGSSLIGLDKFFSVMIAKDGSLTSTGAAFASILFWIMVYAILWIGAEKIAKDDKQIRKSLMLLNMAFSFIASFGFYYITTKYKVHLALFYFLMSIITFGLAFIFGKLALYFNKKEKEERNVSSKAKYGIATGVLLIIIAIVISLAAFFLEMAYKTIGSVA